MSQRRLSAVVFAPFLVAILVHLLDVVLNGAAYGLHVYLAMLVVICGSAVVALAAGRWASGRHGAGDMMLAMVPGIMLLLLATLVVFPDAASTRAPIVLLAALVLVPITWIRLRRSLGVKSRR